MKAQEQSRFIKTPIKRKKGRLAWYKVPKYNRSVRKPVSTKRAARTKELPNGFLTKRAVSFWHWYCNPTFGKLKLLPTGKLFNRIPHKLGKIHREGSLSKRGISLSRKVDWKWVVISFLVGIIVSNHAGASPEPSTPPKAPKIPVLKPISAPKLKKLSKVASVVVEAPKPAPVVSGCSIWHSGINSADILIDRESGGRTCAENAGGCYGILQACPGYPLKVACGTDGACQFAWFTQYKLPTYGSWDAALAHSYAVGWW